MKLVIYRAANAFLYLPTYVAEELGILDTLLRDCGITSIEFRTSLGDVAAVMDMQQENLNNDTIAIAIGDPTAFLSIRVDEKNDFKKDEIKVIGAIINKLAFWAVNHTDKQFESIDKFQNNFSKVIHYEQEYITGYYLGNKVMNLSKIGAGVQVAFGKEIEELEKYNGHGDEKALAISADIVAIAKGTTKSDLKINYRFSKTDDYLTTGILATKTCCDKHEKILSRIIEGIQKSILLIYSSTKLAEKICETISKKPEFNQTSIDGKVIAKIIELIREDKFYPADLNISRKGWTESIEALSRTQLWDSRVLADSYDKHVDNRFVYNAERSLAKQLGIDIDTILPGISFFGKGFKRLLSFLYKHRVGLPTVLILLSVIGYLLYKENVADKIEPKDLFWFLLGLLPSALNVFANRAERKK